MNFYSFKLPVIYYEGNQCNAKQCLVKVNTTFLFFSVNNLKQANHMPVTGTDARPKFEL